MKFSQYMRHRSQLNMDLYHGKHVMQKKGKPCRNVSMKFIRTIVNTLWFSRKCCNLFIYNKEKQSCDFT